MQRIEALADIGSTGDGGCCRIALTTEDRDGRDLVVSWMKELNLEVTTDAIGNVLGTWNVGTGKTKSFQEVAEEISAKHNAVIEYIDMPAILKDNYQAYTCADMTKTNTSLGKI